jgi:Predicted nucleic-acid-binding protein containing a Zn-ribbon
LKEEKIWGTRCKKCNKTLVPARPFCLNCLEDSLEWVEVAQEGTVETWCLVNYKYYDQVKEPPYIIAQIRLDKTDCSLTHFIGGFDLSDVNKVREKMETVARVKAVWSKEKHGDIHDIAYFKPV